MRLNFLGYFARVSFSNNNVSSSLRIFESFSGSGCSAYGINFTFSFNLTAKLILSSSHLFNNLKSTYPLSATTTLPVGIFTK